MPSVNSWAGNCQDWEDIRLQDVQARYYYIHRTAEVMGKKKNWKKQKRFFQLFCIH